MTAETSYADQPDARVRAALERLERVDDAAAHAASAAWWGVAADGDPDAVHQRVVQDFVWYGLPATWPVGVAEHRHVVESLACLLDELGLADYAQLCRSRRTHEVLAAWARGPGHGRRAYRKALDASGIDPPDTAALAWSSAMTPEESDACDHVATVLEEAIADGELSPGRKGWRARQRQLTVAALEEAVPDHPTGHSWRHEVMTARIARWAERWSSPRRRWLIGDLEPWLVNPVEPPEDVETLTAPVRWLLSRAAADEGLPLTERGYLSPSAVREATDQFGWWHHWARGRPSSQSEVPELLMLHEMARDQRWVRRRGRRLRVTRAGAALADDVEATWRAFAAALADGDDFEAFARECALLLVAGGDGTYVHVEMAEHVAVLAAEAGWHDHTTGAPPDDRAAGAAFGPLMGLFEGLGMLRVGGASQLDHVTSAGQITALEAVRACATAPQHRLPGRTA